MAEFGSPSSTSVTDQETPVRRSGPGRLSGRESSSFYASPTRQKHRGSTSYWEEVDGNKSKVSLELTSHDERTWIRSQHETFVNWVNEKLREGGAKTKAVTDLTVDLQDGTVLIRLVETLTGKKMKQYNKAPSITAHKLDNLDMLFGFMRSNGIKVIGIGSHNIHEGDIKRILGLIGTLIQKYQIRMGGTQVSNKALMVDWLSALLPAWNITNLGKDWNDGRALMALINVVKPGIASDASKLDPSKHVKNCTLAINIAFNHLKIPKLISADNLSSSSIDELSIITYLSYFRDPARARLLKWVRRMLPQFNISNFQADWADGQAFEALANKCIPDVLAELTDDENNDALDKNIQSMFDMFSKKLGIKISFTAKKLISGEVEELQVMTLVLWIKNGKLQPLANEVVVSGPGITEAIVGKDSVFHVDATKAGPGKLTVHANYEGGKKMDCHVRGQGRQATVTYSPRKPGNITISVRWSGDEVAGSPFTVTATDLLKVQIIGIEHHEKVVCMNKPIELMMDTEKAGQGELTAHLEYDSGPPIQAEVVKQTETTIKLKYTPTISGQPMLHFFWNRDEMHHLAFRYTVIDASSYQVVEKVKSRAYTVLERVAFSVETKGEPLSALHMAAILEGDDVQVPIKFETTDKGVGQATFHPTQPGTYRIEVACVDQLVQGSPFQVEVVDPSQCKMVEEIPKYVQLKVPYTIEVDTNEAGSGGLTFECEEKEDTNIFEADINPPDESGISKVKLVPLREGNHLVTIKFQGTAIPGSPFRISVLDPSRCKISGEILEKKFGTVSKPIRFKMTVDPLDDIKPVIKASGPTAKYTPEVKQTDENVYIVQFSPWEVGTHEISVTYGDFHVPNSPFTVTVTTFDSATCSATGSGLQKAAAGTPAQFQVLANAKGLIKDGTLKLKVQGVVSGKECKVRARDNKNGSYTVAYIVRDPGAYLISIIADEKQIPGSPFRLTAIAPPSAEKCRMFGPMLKPGVVLTIGKPMEFTVDCSEAGTGDLSVRAFGPGNTQARVYLAKDSKKAIYNAKLDPTRHGRYRVSVKWAGEHIPGSPFMISIYPGADASKCVAYGPGLQDGIVGKPCMFTIETRDAGAGTLKVRLHGVRDAFKIDIKPADSSRTLQANYNPKKPGDYLVTIKWSDKHIPGSPFRVKIDGEDNIVPTDSNIKIEPYDEPMSSTVEEEVDEANWGDEDEEKSTTPADTETPNKRRRRQRKGQKSPSSRTPQPLTSEEGSVPAFSPNSRHTNYRQAFASGGKARSPDRAGKARKGRK